MSSLRLAIKQSLNESAQPLRPQKDRRRRNGNERRRRRPDHLGEYERASIPSEREECLFHDTQDRDTEALRAQREQLARFSAGPNDGDMSTVGNSSDTERDSDSGRETENSSFTHSDMSDSEREDDALEEKEDVSVSSEENEATFDDDQSCTELSMMSGSRARGGRFVSAENGSVGSRSHRSVGSRSHHSALHVSKTSDRSIHSEIAPRSTLCDPESQFSPLSRKKQKLRKKLKGRLGETFQFDDSSSKDNPSSRTDSVSHPQHSRVGYDDEKHCHVDVDTYGESSKQDRSENRENNMEENHFRKKKKKKRKPSSVPPPSEHVLSWVRGMSQNRQRRKMRVGLRVKVQFDMSTEQSDSGRKKKRIRWYGGLVTDVRAGGRSINVLYDDGTSEYVNFPDDDIIVDAVENGLHADVAGGDTFGLNPFIPPPRKEEDSNYDDVAEQEMEQTCLGDAVVVSDEAAQETERRVKRKDSKSGMRNYSVGNGHVSNSVESGVSEGVVKKKFDHSADNGSLEQENGTENCGSFSLDHVSKCSSELSQKLKKKSRHFKSLDRGLHDDKAGPHGRTGDQRFDVSYDSHGCDDSRGTGRVVTTDGEDGSSLHSLTASSGGRRKKLKSKKRRRDKQNVLDKTRKGCGSSDSVRSGLFDGAFRRRERLGSDDEHCKVPEYVGGVGSMDGINDVVDVISASCSGESGNSSWKSPIHDSTSSMPNGRSTACDAQGYGKVVKKKGKKKRDKHEKFVKSLKSPNSSQPDASLNAESTHGRSDLKRKRICIPREVSPMHATKRSKTDAMLCDKQSNATESKKRDTDSGVHQQRCATDESGGSCDEIEIEANRSISRRWERSHPGKEKLRRSPRSRSVSPVPSESRSTCDSDENISFYDSLMYRSSRRAAQKANQRIVAKEDPLVDAYGSSTKKQRKEQSEHPTKKQTNVRARQHITVEGGGPSQRPECDDGEKSHDDSDDEEELSADSQEQNWVQCDRCMKWRLLPQSLSMDELPDRWYCELNIYDSKRRSCDAPEQTADEVLQEGDQDADDSSRTVKDLKSRGGKKKRRKSSFRGGPGLKVSEITVTNEAKNRPELSEAEMEVADILRVRKAIHSSPKDASLLDKSGHAKHTDLTLTSAKPKVPRVASDSVLDKTGRADAKLTDVENKSGLFKSGKTGDKMKSETFGASDVITSSVDSENFESVGVKSASCSVTRERVTNTPLKPRKKEGARAETCGKKEFSGLSTSSSVKEKKCSKIGGSSQVATVGDIEAVKGLTASSDKSEDHTSHKKPSSRHKVGRKKEKELRLSDGGSSHKSSSKHKHDQKSSSSSKHDQKGGVSSKNDVRSGSKHDLKGVLSVKTEDRGVASVKHEPKAGSAGKHDHKGGSSSKNDHKVVPSTKHEPKHDVKREEKTSLGENQQEWVQCEKCDKWRRLPPRIRAADLPDVWYCSMNSWDPRSATCAAAEDKPDAGAREYTILGQDSSGRVRSSSSNPSCGSSGGSSNKLSYRNLIFGNGRKHNRHGSERARAVDSLFVDPSTLHGAYDADGERCVPTVLYAHSSAFVPRSSNRSTDEAQREEHTSVLNLMARSKLWKELQNRSPRTVESDQLAVGSLLSLSGGSVLGRCNVSDSMKKLIFHVLGSEKMAAHEVLMEAQCGTWTGEESVTEEWAELRASCTMEVVCLALDQLVEDQLVEIVFEGPQQAKLFRRRSSVCAAPVSHGGTGATRISRCIKLVKPWKAVGSSGKDCRWSDAAECEELLQKAHQRFHALAERMGPDPLHL